jgi:signal transduction histidine kinase/ActR/RegA family two-component response regulator
MSVDPDVIRSEPHHEIGTLLERQADLIIERWCRRAVEEQPHANRVHHSVLLDHLQELLKRLGRSLRESHNSFTYQHYLPASTHGVQRWEAGWSLPEVVRDHQILRLVIIDFFDETLDRQLSNREQLAIGLALDEAIGASVVAYVNGRDEYLKQLEEMRSEESKEAQKRLEAQAASLKEADRRKNEFLAILAHELRNPLAPIRNAVQVLSLQDPPDPAVQWPREIIERQVQQLNRMVDDLLDVARITQAKIKLHKEPVEVGTVIARAIEMSQPLIDVRKHRLTVVPPAAPMWLEGDAVRLAQVVANLLNNAAKYTEEGGQIWLLAERMENEIVIRVRDTGIGIPADLLPRVFDPFIQEERSPDRAHGGLGIGLALVRSLVELHGGRVEASSAGRGQGSEFVLHLPVLAQAPPSTSKKKASDARGKLPGRRILVVDDNIDSAETLALLLRLGGHDVHTAHSGRNALESAQINRPEIVMLDIGMPGMDGLEVARRLRDELGLTDVLLVAMTGYGQDEDRRRSQVAGFNSHLVKPIDLEHLNSLLERWEQKQNNGDGQVDA